MTQLNPLNEPQELPKTEESPNQTNSSNLITEDVFNLIENVLRPLATQQLIEKKFKLQNSGDVTVVKFEAAKNLIVTLKVPFLRKNGTIYESPETSRVSSFSLDDYLKFNPESEFVQQLLTGKPIIFV